MKGLVWSDGVIGNQPLSNILVESVEVRAPMAVIEPFFNQGFDQSLYFRIVFGCPGT